MIDHLLCAKAGRFLDGKPNSADCPGIVWVSICVWRYLLGLCIGIVTKLPEIFKEVLKPRIGLEQCINNLVLAGTVLAAAALAFAITSYLLISDSSY